MCVGSAVYTDFLVDEELRHSQETIVERVRHLSLEIVGRDRNTINQIGQTRTGGTAEGGYGRSEPVPSCGVGWLPAWPPP
jgi:hypothetical protein